MTAHRQSMKKFISALSDRVDRPIVDMTKLTGDYDFTLIWSPDVTPEPGGAAEAPAPGPAGLVADAAPQLFDALERELGLKLAPRKVATDIMVVDSANRVPADN
jgi:uncharacterized protein (TIGR03435 family)